MSNQLHSGQGRDINVFAGQSLAVSSITGAYTATIIAGADTGTALATASTGGATYGPYAGGVTIRLQAGEGGLIDYDAAVSPVLNYAAPLRSGYNSSGDTASAVDAAGDVFTIPDVVDPRDWTGFDLTGNHDNSTILAAAVAEAAYKSRPAYGFSCSKRLHLPMGRIVFSEQLLVTQNLWMEGVMGADGATELRWTGADGVAAIATSNTADVSYCKLSNFRLKDFRTTPTTGRGIDLRRVKNGTTLQGLQVFQFPVEQVYIGADSGQSSDCISIDDLWVHSSVATATGLLLERVDNAILLRNIKSDLATTPANDGYVIRIQQITNDNAVVDICGVKHESDNKCPTISLPQTTHGNLSIRSVNQRNPAGGAAGAGDIIQFGASSAGNAYAFGWGGTITTGSSSETGARVSMENITGTNHSDWANAATPTAAATVKGLGTGQFLCGNVIRAAFGVNGRFVRDGLAANGIPNGSVYGNVGEEVVRSDAGSTTCSRWLKQFGNGTNTGWTPLTPDTQSPAFSGSFACNLQSGNRVVVGALTGTLTHSNPINVPAQGVEVIYEFTQDGTGGRGITWSSLHKGSWPTGSGTAGQKKTATGRSDGTNLVFVSDSGWD